MNKEAPNWPFRVLHWFCDPEIVDDVEGDLRERYQRKYTHRKFADGLLVRDVLLLFRPGIIKTLEGTQKLNYYGMIKNYFKITWRSLLRQKLYSAINIGGLAIGIATFIQMFLYVEHERSFDHFFPHGDQIYSIYQQQPGNESMGTDLYAVTPAGLTPVLLSDYPETQAATTLDQYNTLIGAGEAHYLEDVLFADEYYFEVFGHHFLQGHPKSALADGKGAVITTSFAQKVFGKTDVLGEKITFWDDKEAYVTGIIEDLPENSSLQFSLILSLQASEYYREERVKQEWNGNNYYTFVTLKRQTDLKAFERKLPAILEKHWRANGEPGIYMLSPMTDFHLRNQINEDIGLKGNAQQLTMFSIIAIIVLTLACVNYMNLAIARSVNRAKEVGLRKAIGARKQQLIAQFLCESVIMSGLALILAMIMLHFITPVFGRMVERSLDITMIYELGLIPWMLLLVVGIGVVSGSYPALFMSSLQPILVLKGKSDSRGYGRNIQKTLIITQYAISTIMITMSAIVYLQMEFIRHKDLGFQKEQVLTVQMRSSNTRNQVDLLRNQFMTNPLTAQVSFSSSLPTQVQSSTFLNNDRTGGNIYRLNVDEQFLQVYGLVLLAGRFLSDEIDTEEKSNFVINETAVKALGFTVDNAVGQTFVNEGGETKNIVGVVKDFHMHSMHIPVAPLMISVRPYRRFASFKVNPANIKETLSIIEKTFQQYSTYPFQYQFIDDHFNQLYKHDNRQGQIFGFFTTLAILIACLGLFGLAAFTAAQKTKEIGLRKVLGASVQDIILLFSKSFIFLVMISFLLSLPFSWYLASNWLQGFAYRVEIGWWVYLMGGAMALILAFLTISSQSVKVSMINPVESLRDE